MAAGDRYQVKFIVEHRDQPARIEIKSGNVRDLFFLQIGDYKDDLEELFPNHRCISNLVLDIDFEGNEDVSYIIRFVPLCRFEVRLYLGTRYDAKFLEFHTDDPAEILPWAEKHGQVVEPELTSYFVHRGYASRNIQEFYRREFPEELLEIMRKFPDFLERLYRSKRKRYLEDFQAIFLELMAKPVNT